MRKKLTALLLCLTLLLTGCAYAAVEEQRQEDVFDLYFREADLDRAPGGDALRAEQVYLEGASGWDAARLAEALLTKLIDGPEDLTLKSTLPVGTTLLSVTVDGSRASVDLSAAYRTLSGVALTLADYAITLTLTQLHAITSVTITVRGQELAYRDTHNFSARDLLLSTDEDVVGTIPVSLYFLDKDGLLIPEDRMLDLYEGDTQVAAVVKAMENGPERKGLSVPLPEGFHVLSVWQEEETCYVNLPSAALETLTGDIPLKTALQALGWSLCSLESVEEVRFLVDGEFARSYGDVSVEEVYTG